MVSCFKFDTQKIKKTKEYTKNCNKNFEIFFLFQTSKSNEMLSGLRYFEHALKDNGRGKPKPSFSWGAVDMGSVARCFQQLCVKAVDVFQSEPRLLEVNSPTYVLGELVTF